MTNHGQDTPATKAYLRELRRRARRLPRTRREELEGEIREHLREALPPGSGEVKEREALRLLGTPHEIVAEERARLGLPPASGPGAREWAAIVLLLLGGFVFLFGWVLGLVLLWSSATWTLRDKLIGSLLLPGGLTASVTLLAMGSFASGSETCFASDDGAGNITRTCSESGGGSVFGAVLLIVLALSPIATAIYLTWRARSAGAVATA